MQNPIIKFLDKRLVKRQFSDAAIVISETDGPGSTINLYRRMAICSYAFCPICGAGRPVSPVRKEDTVNGLPSGISDKGIHWLCLVCKYEFSLSDIYIKIHGIEYGSLLEGYRKIEG